MKNSGKYGSCNDLKAELRRHSITYTMLSDLLGMTPATISNKMNGHREFRAGELAVITNMLNEQVGYRKHMVDDFIPKESLVC